MTNTKRDNQEMTVIPIPFRLFKLLGRYCPIPIYKLSKWDECLNWESMIFQFKNWEIFGICLLAVSLILTGCEKKEKLQASTFQFSINPPAKAVVKGQTQTFRIVTSAAGDAEWAVAHSTVGTLNTSIGPTVVFTAVEYGDTRITASMNGVVTIAPVTVVSSYSPGASGKFDIYSDLGLPTGADIDPYIYVDPSLNPNVIQISEQINGAEWTPEGVKFQKTVLGTTALTPSWGVTLDMGETGHNRDLHTFFDENKSLKFWIRFHRIVTEPVKVRLQSGQLPGATATKTLTLGGAHFNSSNTGWQEVNVPLNDAGFAVLGAFDNTKIIVPFSILLQAPGSSLTYDVDAVRWE